MPTQPEPIPQSLANCRSPQLHAPRAAVVEVADLAQQQGVTPLRDFDALLAGCDFWPDDETADDFVAAVRNWRREVTERRHL